MVERQRPIDQRDTADLGDCRRHDGGGQQRISGMQPDAEAEQDEFRELPGRRHFAPARRCLRLAHVTPH